MNEETRGPDRSAVIHLADARVRIPGPAGEHAVGLLQRGTLKVKLSCPVRPNTQTPHAQDEVYVIIRGRGVLIHDGKRDEFQPGDLMFVAAGTEHHFEDFSDDLAVWVVFFGPEGGEAAVGTAEGAGVGAEAELRALLESLVAAWNRGDPKAFAGLFTPDADYVTGDGEWLHGRRAIEGLVRATTAGTRAAIQGSASIRETGAAASVAFRWVAEPGPGDAAAGGVVTCVAVRRGERWLIDRLQNTDEAAGSRGSGPTTGGGA